MRPIYFIALATLFLVGCGAAAGGGEPGHPLVTPEPEPILENITITAGDTVLGGVLFDNETARALAERLPLTVSLWDPAENFAKAFDLDDPLPDAAVHTRSYELGGLAYWDDGPSVAIFYNDDLLETIVPVTTIGRVRALADFIQADVGGELFSIRTVETYPVGINDVIDQAAQEQAANARPELADHIDNLDDYDTIFIGYPNWWGDLPMPVYSFFDEYDLSGKTAGGLDEIADFSQKKFPTPLPNLKLQQKSGQQKGPTARKRLDNTVKRT